jgi:hypothetical protein
MEMKMTGETLYELSQPDNGYTWLHMTAEECMEEILSDDGGRFEMRRAKDGDGWWLWRRPLNGDWSKLEFSLEADKAAARRECLHKLFEDGHRGGRHGDRYYIQTMDKYRQYLTEELAALIENDGEDHEINTIRKWIAAATDPASHGKQ